MDTTKTILKLAMIVLTVGLSCVVLTMDANMAAGEAPDIQVEVAGALG